MVKLFIPHAGLVIQSRLPLCDPLHCSPPGSSVHGILQPRTLERVAMPSSSGSSRPRDWRPCIAGGFLTVQGQVPPSNPRKPVVKYLPTQRWTKTDGSCTWNLGASPQSQRRVIWKELREEGWWGVWYSEPNHWWTHFSGRKGIYSNNHIIIFH